MATALFISRDDIIKNTMLSGNLSDDKFLQCVKVAQEIHIRNYLGTDLYDKISADIIASSLTGDYLTLVNTYVKPMLIHYAMVEYLPFAAYTVSNKGVFKHTSENSEGVSKEEVDYLVEKERKTAGYYTQRLIDYICFNKSKYPEYDTNTNDDINPSTETYTTGWLL